MHCYPVLQGSHHGVPGGCASWCLPPTQTELATISPNEPGGIWFQKGKPQVSLCLHPKEEGRCCWRSRRQPWHTRPSGCLRFYHGSRHCSIIWGENHWQQFNSMTKLLHIRQRSCTGWIQSQGRDAQPENWQFYWRVVEGVGKGVACLERVLVAKKKLSDERIFNICFDQILVVCWSFFYLILFVLLVPTWRKYSRALDDIIPSLHSQKIQIIHTWIQLLCG